MGDKDNIPAFSLVGGPFNKLGLQLGLIKNGTNSIRFGIAIGLSTWIILLILSWMGGALSLFFSINVLASHVRLLVAIPLFFLCETWIAPRMTAFIEYLNESGLIGEEDRPRFLATMQNLSWRKNSWVIELILFVALSVISNRSILSHNSTSIDFILQNADGHATPANLFYSWFCLPLFRFLLVRWVWRLGLWWYFLYKVQQLELNLIPTHSDGVGGLGFLEIVQEYFAPLALSFSAILAASSFEEIKIGTMPFESLYYIIPSLLVLNIVLFAAPLLLFYSKLRDAREKGIKDYMIMASHYVQAFDQKWIRNKMVTGEEQLGTGDIQSLADLTNSLKVIQEMKTFFVSKRLIIVLAVSTLLPFIPLIYLKFDINEIIALLFKRITG